MSWIISSESPDGTKTYYSGAWAPVAAKRAAKRFQRKESAEERLAGIRLVDFGDGAGKSQWQIAAEVVEIS